MSVARIISPESIIVGIVNQFLKPSIIKEFPGLGILFTLQICCENYGFEKDGNTHHPEWERRYNKYLHIIVTMKHNVFISNSDEFDWEDSPLESFKNTSNHNSCWRSDGLQDIVDEYFKAHNYCWRHVPEEHKELPIVAGVDGTFSPCLRNIVTFVKIEKETLKDGYFYRLKSIKKCKFTINVEE